LLNARTAVLRAERTAVLLIAARAVIAVALVAPFVPPASAQPREGRDWSKDTARAVPDWVEDAVVYEVFPRVFSPKGDLAGVTARLDHLRDLGVTVLWLMPVQPLGVEKRKGTFGSPYSIRDYRAVNPDYGTAADLKRLVRAAHTRGLRVILDVVANHTSWDNLLMATPEMYVRDAQGRVQPPNADWSDVAKLDYANPKTREYMIETMAYWLREYDLDGFRCDVAGLVPTGFWEEARPVLERVRKDLFLLAEWSAPELMVRAFDADYAWPFHAALTRVLSTGAPATEIRKAWEEERRTFPRGSLHMRFTDNHDERRAVARFGEPAALAAAALVMTMDGIPLVYNGMEIGDTAESGGPALTERLPIFWPGVERRPEFPVALRSLIALRRGRPALRGGDTVWVRTSDDERIVAFLRRGAGEEVLVAVNLSSRPWTGTLELPDEPDTRNAHRVEDARSAAGTTERFAEVTPAVPLPQQPGGAVPPRPKRDDVWPALGLDAWGFRIYARPARQP
jgi:glycosidase